MLFILAAEGNAAPVLHENQNGKELLVLKFLSNTGNASFLLFYFLSLQISR